MGRVTITSNHKKLSTEIKRRATNYQKNVSDEINTAGLNIESNAKLKLQQHTSKKSFPNVKHPKAGDAKRVMKRIKKTDGTPDNPTAIVEVNELPIGAYLEFGTGIYAKEYLQGRPFDEVQQASEFYKTGKGTIRAFPYLFPSYYEEQPKLIERLKRAKI
jgi:hypothetical protein